MTGMPLVFGKAGCACLEYYGFANGKSGKVILNRTITLKDTWAKEAQKS